MCTQKIVKNTLFAHLFLSSPFFATLIHKMGTQAPHLYHKRLIVPENLSSNDKKHSDFLNF